ncbi:hypothetical protein CA13_30000 [Planctomycetes bacterium CA13]|uniref:Transposase IS204/IS1001/IS1096/IS1165 DDE domain-containing protein n=1 Tax=Novipirellula herctigrandis TaxID=2527986 RepID=A0A5C5Z3K9_9BACT|nr:hypothetical protein CA13_30000 [Planctomycetes bacterium CA13]
MQEKDFCQQILGLESSWFVAEVEDRYRQAATGDATTRNRREVICQRAELLRELWHHETVAQAKAYFDAWYRSVIHTKLAPMKKFARTINERLSNVVSYCTHGFTNALAEGINSKIQSVKRRVGGYRNKDNYKTAICFYFGGLDLHPH